MVQGMQQMMQVFNQLSHSQNPIQGMLGMMGDNPQAKMFGQMVQGNSPQQLETICRNMYKERGVDINQILGMFGYKP